MYFYIGGKILYDSNSITGKFATIRKSDAGVEVREARDPQCGGNMLHLNQKGDEVYLRIREKDGKIVKMDMCMF